ncbi:hypothetical protein Tco_0867983 [Tanacetum coccineum]
MGVNVEDGMVKNAASKLGGFGGSILRNVPYKVIKAIYGEDGNLNKDVSGGVRTCWTSIVHEVRVLQGRGINVADYIRLKLGNGENTRFWVDNWYEGGVIKELFPRMFALELNKNATVSSKLNASSLDNSFRRKARSGIEEMQLNSLAEISRMTTLVPCEDRYVWTLESDGVFSLVLLWLQFEWRLMGMQVSGCLFADSDDRFAYEISSCGYIVYSDCVEVFRGMASLVGLSIRNISPNSKGVC